MTTTGIVGGHWRATVTEWGAIEPWDESPTLDWFVAADDRWHRPSEEATLRQSRSHGTPVVETRVRIPGGDAVHRVYSVADAGGLTVVEVANESSLPIAVAFTGGGLVSPRPPTTVPAQGIDLPADSVIYPIAHRASIVVARAHADSVRALPDAIATAEQVSRGWLAQTQRASRLHLPDSSATDSVTAARCELLLNGPCGGAAEDAASFILGVAELVRLGHSPAIWVPDLAAHLELLARSGAQIPAGVVEAAARVLHAAGEDRAVADLRKMSLAEIEEEEEVPVHPARLPSWWERRLVSSDDLCATILPHGVPDGWVGIDFEAHGLPIGLMSHLSFAIRWHGARPAVLWEVSGPPMTLAHGDWTSAQLAGEALWPRTV